MWVLCHWNTNLQAMQKEKSHLAHPLVEPFGSTTALGEKPVDCAIGLCQSMCQWTKDTHLLGNET